MMNVSNQYLTPEKNINVEMLTKLTWEKYLRNESLTQKLINTLDKEINLSSNSQKKDLNCSVLGPILTSMRNTFSKCRV